RRSGPGEAKEGPHLRACALPGSPARTLSRRLFGSPDPPRPYGHRPTCALFNSVLVRDLVLPPFLPREVGGHQRLEGHAVEIMVQGPAGRDVAHHQDPSAAPSEREVVEPPRHPGGGLSPALATRVRLVQVAGAISHVYVRRGAVA